MTLKRILAGAALAAMTLTAMTPAAQAQSYQGGYDDRGYGYGEPYRYDPCRREQTERTTGGALIGAGIGALAGGNIASGGARTEGAVVGGLLGALVGGNIGRETAACEPGTYRDPAPPPVSGASYGYDGYAYRDSEYRNGYGYDDEDGYDGYAARVRDSDEVEDCRLAKSPIYMPDGRVQERYVRVCRDGSGRYQVVD